MTELPKKRKRLIWYLLSAVSLGFVLLTIFVCLIPTSLLDREFSKEIQEDQNPLLDTIMTAVSWFGYMPYTLILVIGTVLIFYIFRYKREAVFILLTMLSGVVSSMVKWLVNRPRPSAPLVRIIGKNLQQSFPSGHVLFYVVFFGFLTLLMYQLKTINRAVRLIVSGISLSLIFAIGISRVYLGAHWFTDVLGGFLLGILSLYLLSYFYLKKTANNSSV